MTYSWDEIRDFWMQEGTIAYEPEVIMREFDRVERIFGRPWMEAKLTPASGISAHGALLTLEMVRTGRLLACIEDLENADNLFRKLRAGMRATWTELEAAYLLRSHEDVTLSLEPLVMVGTRQRKPDFRIRVADEAWTYVEVTRPDMSEDEVRVRSLGSVLSGVLNLVRREYALEVFLRRQPSPSETGLLQREVQELCRLDGPPSSGVAQ